MCGIRRQSSCGRTALLLACLAGHEGIACYLIKRGADPCIKDAEGLSPLEAAASKGLATTVWLLLEAEGVKGRGAEGPSLPHLLRDAAKHDYHEVLEVLMVERGACLSDLEEARKAAEKLGHWKCLQVIEVSQSSVTASFGVSLEARVGGVCWKSGVR